MVGVFLFHVVMEKGCENGTEKIIFLLYFREISVRLEEMVVILLKFV